MIRIEQKYLREECYIISVSTKHPNDYKDKKDVSKEYILDADIYTHHWELTPIFSEAKTFSLKDASALTCVLNKINKCYYQIVPTFEIQTFESKLNTFPDE